MGTGMLRAVMFAAVALGATAAAAQTQREVWNESQAPFKVFGNTYWVGTKGLGAVLITSASGHVLIDGGLPESVPKIVASIRAVGFKVEDIRLILNTHVHYDHAGGLGELQRLTGARVAASPASAAVLTAGKSGPDDPQFSTLPPIDAIRNVAIVKDGETLKAGQLSVTAHFTPGHTPGGTSWSWRSCERARCLEVVYADSLNPVSSGTFRYTTSPLRTAFERGYATLEALPCDILLAPHPAFANVFEKLAAREAGGQADAFVTPGACRAYVATGRENLAQRIASERAGK